MSSTPSPWALERAKDCDPLDEHEDSAVTRQRIALALDAARRDGAERMREAAARECTATIDYSPWLHAESGTAGACLCRAKIRALDAARVLAGEE